jgi:hypothetical protein
VLDRSNFSPTPPAGDRVILQPPVNLESGDEVQIAPGTPAATPSLQQSRIARAFAPNTQASPTTW